MSSLIARNASSTSERWFLERLLKPRALSLERLLEPRALSLNPAIDVAPEGNEIPRRLVPNLFQTLVLLPFETLDVIRQVR